MGEEDVNLEELEGLSFEALADKTVRLGVERVVEAAQEKYHNGAWERFRDRLWRGAHYFMCEARHTALSTYMINHQTTELSPEQIVAANREAAEVYAPYQKIHAVLLETMRCTK